MATVHALTVDVEDWFQVLNMQHIIARAQWRDFDLRCIDATRRLLDLLAKRNARATFFFLGWIAERAPELVRQVQQAGHEIASHGYDHRLLSELGEAGFAADLARTEAILEAACGVKPVAFRACTWSVTSATRWAPAVLRQRGYDLDSSIFPVRHPDYGVPGAPRSPYRIQTPAGTLIEVPPLTWSVLGRHLPVGGGGYLRLLPLSWLERGLRQQERLGSFGCVYLHPWELDPGQPRQKLGGIRGFRHYVNLSRTAGKLDALLSRHRFGTLRDALAHSPELPVVDAARLLG